MKHINEDGRSMVEMLGVLAIIGVLSVGGIAGYSKAMNKYKINKTTDQVSMLVANIRTLFSSQGNYDGLNNASAIRFGVVPNDMYTGTPATTATSYTITNAFNGDVTIKSSQGRTADDDEVEAFTIVYEGLSAEACVTIATGDWGSGQASGLIGIAAGKTGVEEGVDKILTDDSTNTTAGADLVVAAPGGQGGAGADADTGQVGSAAVSTPIKVTDAVNACSGSGSTNIVAWKYY